MAFTVEDGTGVSGANALISLANANTYWSDRANATWAALTDAAKQAAIVEASEYLSASVLWAGNPVALDQYLAWPRLPPFLTPVAASYYYPNITPLSWEGVPTAVKNATARLALIVAGGTSLYSSVSSADLVSRVKAGSVEVEFSEQGKAAAATGQPSFPWLADMLRAYLDEDSSVTHKLVRA